MHHFLNKRIIILTLNIIIFFTMMNFLTMDESIKKCICIFTFIGICWITEVLPLSITALLVPVLASTLGILSVFDAFVNFANPIIFLFLGGFALAAALHKHKIDIAIATYIISLTKGHFLLTAILIFITTAFISMWISNTATAVMFLPIAIGILSEIKSKENNNYHLFLLIGIAYSASIGGIGTIVGSPPNAIAAATFGINFLDWMKVGLPTVIILLPLAILLLLIIFRPYNSEKIKIKKVKIEFTSDSIMTLFIFAITVLAWMMSVPLSEWIGISTNLDSVIAVTAIILLAASGVVTWSDIEKNTSWGILILFGGGLTLSAILSASGTIAYLANEYEHILLNIPNWIIILSIIAFVVFLTELVSNTASAALLIPLFMVFATAVGFPPESLSIAIAIAASCAFMLPVATPPNAIIFGSGFVRQKDLMRAGIFINILSILVISVLSFILY